MFATVTHRKHWIRARTRTQNRSWVRKDRDWRYNSRTLLSQTVTEADTDRQVCQVSHLRPAASPGAWRSRRSSAARSSASCRSWAASDNPDWLEASPSLPPWSDWPGTPTRDAHGKLPADWSGSQQHSMKTNPDPDLDPVPILQLLLIPQVVKKWTSDWGDPDQSRIRSDSGPAPGPAPGSLPGATRRSAAVCRRAAAPCSGPSGPPHTPRLTETPAGLTPATTGGAKLPAFTIKACSERRLSDRNT